MIGTTVEKRSRSPTRQRISAIVNGTMSRTAQANQMTRSSARC
ncbi:MAG: hypothetical protein RBJ76_15065 [Stenomitos frigidus ULC029]